MADRLRFLPNCKGAKKRTNLRRKCDFVIDLPASVMEEDGFEVEDARSFDSQSALVLFEPITPLATVPEVATLLEAMGGDAQYDRLEKALYRVVREDMGLDYDVPIAKVCQAIKEKKSKEASC
ncbi:hypothetical protein AMTRI_Chr08g205970 [Amborella trichopoda]